MPQLYLKHKNFSKPQFLHLQIFCLFMLSIGFCYFIFLYIDIRLHVKKAKQAVKEKETRMKLFEEQLQRTEVWLLR